MGAVAWSQPPGSGSICSSSVSFFYVLACLVWPWQPIRLALGQLRAGLALARCSASSVLSSSQMRPAPQHPGHIPMGHVSQPASVPLVEELLVGTALPGSVSVAFFLSRRLDPLCARTTPT